MNEWETEKATFLRFADTVRKAESAEHLRNLLQADVEAPYHTYDLVWVAGIPENIGTGLSGLLGKTLSDDGLPK